MKYNTSISIENNSWVGRVFDEAGKEVYKSAPNQDQMRVAKDIMNYFASGQISYPGSVPSAKFSAPTPTPPKITVQRKCCGKG